MNQDLITLRHALETIARLHRMKDLTEAKQIARDALAKVTTTDPIGRLGRVKEYTAGILSEFTLLVEENDALRKNTSKEAK